VNKYNKHYVAQDRILLITERAMYNVNPSGYMINKDPIELRKIKKISVSPMTDNFFVIHCSDDNNNKTDYIFDSSKKTEILKVFADAYQKATRSMLKFNVSENIDHFTSKGEKVLKFEEAKEDQKDQVEIKETGSGALITVRPEQSVTGELGADLIQDIYNGQKLRRRESLVRWFDKCGDYLHIANAKVMPKLSKKYGDNELLFSGMVAKMNKRFTVQNRKMIVTDQAIYNLDEGNLLK
jgi:myosin I